MIITKISRNAGTTIVRVVCAVAFAVFTFTYLYFYQADVLAATQHVLSNGATHYDRTIGAVLITFGLMLIQWAVHTVARLNGLTHALTYIPSALFLAALTAVSPDVEGRFSWGAWWWLLPLLLLLWGSMVYVAKLIPLRHYRSWFFLLSLWVNVLSLSAICMVVGLIGNDNDVFHYRMRAECCLLRGDIDGTLLAGKKSKETDASLTMLRAYALARKGQLGEKLFNYPITSHSSDLLPMRSSGNAQCIMFPTDSIYKFLGARPLVKQDMSSYLSVLTTTDKATSAVADYRLCALLIDRDLDAFVKLLPQYYAIDDNLPRHYREALTLYTHLRSNPTIVYHNTVMDTDFADLQALERKQPNASARRLALYDQYGSTYWCYYEDRGK